MAYPGHFYKFSFGGGLIGGEEWTNSINIASDSIFGIDPSVEARMNDDLNNFTANLETFFTAISTLIYSGTTLTWSKLAIIGPDGRYAAAPVSRPIADKRGSGPIALPNQVACALSMQSDAWGARGKNGRIYLAGVAIKIGGDGLMTVADRDKLATAFAAFIDGLNDSANIVLASDAAVVVASAVGEGAFNKVVRVRVGRVLDTIRSRRTSMNEDYGTVNIGEDTVESGV